MAFWKSYPYTDFHELNLDWIIRKVQEGYTLPIASALKLGGIKVGSGLSIDSGGVLSATGGSSAMVVTIVGTVPSKTNAEIYAAYQAGTPVFAIHEENWYVLSTCLEDSYARFSRVPFIREAPLGEYGLYINNFTIINDLVEDNYIKKYPIIPTCTGEEGTYTLKCSLDNVGIPTYEWVADE